MADSSWDMTFATAPATPMARGSEAVWTAAPSTRGVDGDPSPSARVSPPIVEATAPTTSTLQRSHLADGGDMPSRALRHRKSIERIQPTSSPRPSLSPSATSSYHFETKRVPSSRSIRDRILEYERAASPIARSPSSLARERMSESERVAIASPYRKSSSALRKSSPSATSSPSHSPAHSTASRSAASSPGIPRALAVPTVATSPFPTASQLRTTADVPPPSSTSYLPSSSSPLHFAPSSASRPQLRASRRESSPGLNASRLGGINFGNEESFLGSVGDKTYDELEVAVADNNRRRSFGIALRAPLPPSPDDSSFGELPSSPVSPSRSVRRSSPEVDAEAQPTERHQDRAAVERSPSQPTSRAQDRATVERSPSPHAAPSVRISVDEDRDSIAMPPPPIPQPRDRALLRTPSAATARHSPRRGSPLRERVDEDEPVTSVEGSAVRPRTTSTTSSSESNTAHSPRLRRHESVSTLGSLGGGSLLRDMGKADSLRSVDASFHWDRIDRQAAASRLDSRLPDLLDAGSFRLSPPRNRPSAREVFEEKEYLASPAATPSVRARTYSQNHASNVQTPRRATRPISLDPDMAGDMTLDLQQLVRRSGRPKRPSGTEESLLGPTVGELADQLADLSDADDDANASVMRQHRSAPPVATHREDEHAARSEEPHHEIGAGLHRTSSVRSATSSQRSGSHSGLERAGSTRTLQRSDSARTLQRSDSTRSTGIQRSSSVRSQLAPSGSMRTMPTSTSGRSLASLATPRRDRPDVPLTMRKRAQERATGVTAAPGGIPKSASATSATSEDRWADAVERDLVSELKPKPAATERRGLPSSASSRRLNPGPSGLTRTSSVRSVRASDAGSGTGASTAGTTASTRLLARSSSVRQALVAGSSSTARETTQPGRTTAPGLPRSGSRPSLASRSMPPPPVPQRAMPAPRTSLAAKSTLSAPPQRSSLLPSSRTPAPAPTLPKSSSRPSLALPRSNSRPSLAPGSLPKSSSRQSLAPSLPKSSSRPSLAPAALPKSSSRSSLAPALPKSSSRTSLAPRPRPSLAPSSAAPALSEAADTVNAPRRPAAPGAGVALARTKLSAPPALERIPAGREPASMGVRSSRPSVTSSTTSARLAAAREQREQREQQVPATPAGRAPRAAMVPRTAVRARPV